MTGLTDTERPQRQQRKVEPAPLDTERSIHRKPCSRAWQQYTAEREVLDLYLDANLVVLSACETARGHAQDTEGVQSLARAFLHAGARSVIASLWPVSDWSTAETMQELYAPMLQDGLPPAAALQQARLSVRRSGTTRGVTTTGSTSELSIASGHPFFWAPFIFIGAPNR